MNDVNLIAKYGTDVDVPEHMVETGMWLTICDLSINIKKHVDGVHIAVYKLGFEMDDAINEIYIINDEGTNEKSKNILD